MATSGGTPGNKKKAQLKLIRGGLSEPPSLFSEFEAFFADPAAQEFLPAPELSPGLPLGSIIEVLGPLKTQWLIQFFKTHPQLKVFWADREHPSLPSTLHQGGVDLSRITFGTLGMNLIVPLGKVIESESYTVIVAPNRFSESHSFKTLAAFTQRTKSILILLGDKSPCTAWPLPLQIAVNEGTDRDFGIEVLRQTH